MRRTAAKTTTRKPAAKTSAGRKAAPPASAKVWGRDVTQYADKEPTDLHKAFATWIVTEVGFNPNDAASKREAFLMGVSIATAARPAFQSSDFLAAWYEESGTAKRGRGATADNATSAKGRSKPKNEEPEEEVDEEDAVDLDELEEELSAMAIGALRKVAKEDYELTLKAGSTKKDIVNAILESVEAESEEDEDDEEDAEDEEGIDLEELQEELEGLDAAELKAAAKEYGVTPKRGERKAALIDRILQTVEEEAAEEDDTEEDEEPEEETPKRGAKTKGSKEFLF